MTSTMISPILPIETGQLIVRGIQDMLGKESLLALLGLVKVSYANEMDDVRLGKDFTPLKLSTIQFFLEAIYGQAGGQGVILRAGRTFFDDVLRTYGNEIGLMDMDVLTLPTKKRIRSGLVLLSKAVASAFNSNIQIVEDDENWCWRVENCPWCLQYKGTSFPHCTFDSGFLQAYLSWATGGKGYAIRETECLCTGAAACITQVRKTPLM
jgi:predicted hydrocarbon binding protein